MSVGVRPEKIALGNGGVNRLTGTMKETAYIGVATRSSCDPVGELTVFAPERRGGRPAPAAGQRRDALVDARRDVRRRPRRGEQRMTTQLTRRALVQRGAAGVTLPAPAAASSPPAAAGGGGRRQQRRASRTSSTSRTGSSTSTFRRRGRRGDDRPHDARAVHPEDGHQGQLLRGHQREPRVLREGAGAACARARESVETSSSSTDNDRFLGEYIETAGLKSSTRI